MKYVLISKDAMCTDYLPTYGNGLWNTPNIDDLAHKGTVFLNHYTAAPSTVMSFFSMITGKYGHETPYEMYERIHDVYQGETFFTKLKRKGYTCHIVWGDIWKVLPDYFDCYRGDVTIHNIDGFRQGVGAHYKHDGFLSSDEEKKQKTFDMIQQETERILSSEDNVFLWIHFPHVINGEVAYGSDIELFDKYVGMIRSLVPDNCIAITADHGNMNGHKGKICYGYDVYQPNIRIPLITPRIGSLEVYRDNSCSVDLYDILFEGIIPQHRFIYSDSAYCAQHHRKLAIIYSHYKYIFNKSSGTEELYDLAFDPTEEFSVLDDYIFDPDRKVNAPSRELYYYPEWDKLAEVRALLRAEKARIWRNGTLKTVVKSSIKQKILPLYKKMHRVQSNAKIADI